MTSKSITTIFNHPIGSKIINRSQDILSHTNEVLDWWNMDLYERTPSISYQNNTKVANLDLAAFLFALSNRGAVIKLPTYKGMRNRKIKEGQTLSSTENRHGKLVGVFANKDIFTFGVRIIDVNVMSTDQVGDFRNFNITDLNGNWYQGWDTIEFLPTENESKFTSDKNLWDGNTIYFQYFVHPNRWTSLYGQSYIMTKMLIDRLQDEAKNYKEQIEDMLNNGITTPQSEGKKPHPYQFRDKDEELISVRAEKFEVEVNTPEYENNYPEFEQNQDNLLDLIRRKRKIQYKIIPRLRFNIRATELAFRNYGYDKDRNERFPFWANDLIWERDFRKYRAKKTWDKLNIEQFNGKEISILKRIDEKTEKVKNTEYHTNKEVENA